MSAVIFDMDGVIIDSEPVHFRIEAALFEEFGIAVPREEHESYVGTASHEMFRRIGATHGARWQEANLTLDDVVALERRRYLRELHEQMVPFVPGTIQLMINLYQAGHRIAIASSAPHEQIDEVVRQAHIGAIVKCRVSGDDVARSKPDPEIFLTAAACTGTPPAECWVIEDSAHGVAAARAAGMRCIGFRNSGSGAQDLSAATAIATSMSAVARIIALGH